MFFIQLLIILAATKLAGDLSVRLGQPSVLGKLIAGILIGPAVFGWIESSELIAAFSEIGVLLLMFMAGLETDIKDLNRNRNASIAVGVGGIIFPLVSGYFAGLLIGFDQMMALFLGLVLSATSVSITVQTMKELGRLNTKESTTILGAALVDDILVVIALAFLMSFAGTADVNLGAIIGKKVLFFVLIVLLGWKLVPYFMKKTASLRVSETVISAGLMICFLFALLAEKLGVAGIIGAFAAGVAVSQTPFHRQVEEKIEPIAYAIFVPVFFVSIGLSVSFEGFMSQIGVIAGLTVLAVSTKLLGSGLGAFVTGFNLRSSIGIGPGMISRGEVALIIAAIGLQSNLLPQQYYTSVIIVIILTTLITPPLLKLIFGDGKGESETVL